MSGPPFQPWYWGDYFRDTMHLSCEEHGAYMLLCGVYWSNGESLPDDDRHLQKICKLSAHKWKKIRPTVVKFFEQKDGRLFHKRIERDLSKFAEDSDKRSEKARAAAAARWSKADAPSMHEECSDNAISEPESESIYTEAQETLFPDSDPPDKEQKAPEGNADESFNRFYAAYPRKAGRGQARKAYNTALKKVDAGALQRAVEAFARLCEGKESQYIKHPATWLNGECWADEAVKAEMGQAPAADEAVRYDWYKAISEWRETGMWYAPGEPPDKPGCVVPSKILLELGL